jgi:hypothetical protein
MILISYVFSPSVKLHDMTSLSQIHSNDMVEELTLKVPEEDTKEIDVQQKSTMIRRHEQTHCNLLKVCWLWFCGLNNENDDYSDHHPAINENGEMINKEKPILTHTKERPWIKWLLNGNLILILLVEITLFIIFSIPAKYTFFRE